MSSFFRVLFGELVRNLAQHGAKESQLRSCGVDGWLFSHVPTLYRHQIYLGADFAVESKGSLGRDLPTAITDPVEPSLRQDRRRIFRSATVGNAVMIGPIKSWSCKRKPLEHKV